MEVVQGVWVDQAELGVLVIWVQMAAGVPHRPGVAAVVLEVAEVMAATAEEAVQVLVEGSQVGTIAGHVNAYRPFLVRDWR